MANARRTPAITQQARAAIRERASGESDGVIARKAGTAAMGSAITNSDPNASSMYSNRLISNTAPARRPSFHE
jgi:hypothetical protein